ncbi:MAG: NAD(P)H-hydrate dehydratase [Nanoarchaeota archaeon]|nr:NAD(P)H-hydrate dehydratase [Nanoarchaeota archaeon]
MRYISSKDISLKPRKATAHKGNFGKVLIISGSKDYVGAPALAGLAALRAGSDLSIIAAPEKTAWAINCLSPDLITRKFPGDYFMLKHAKEAIRLAMSADAVLIGCGLGLKSGKFISKVVDGIGTPLVLDADAIKSVSLKQVDHAVFTPHSKELKMLLTNSGYGRINKIKDKKKKMHELQKVLNHNIILLKGNIDMIISKDKIAYNKTGNPGMTKGGTGDALAGLAAGFIAQGYNLFDSCCWAAYINGMAGDILLKKKKGYFFIASDIVEDIGKIVERMRKRKR